MKLRRLPETDLARIAPLSTDEKRTALRSFNSGGGSWSYDPARLQNINIVNPNNPLGLVVQRPNIGVVRKLVAANCRCEAQLKSCLEVTDLFHTWCEHNVEGAVERRIPSMPLGSVGIVRFWEDYFVRIDGVYHSLFLDYRRGKGLTSLARKFAFSMMHQRVRLAEPDFYDVGLAILQFSQSGKTRVVRPFMDDGSDLYSLAELSDMIDETYRIWAEVLAERRYEEPPRRASGLFG